MKLIHMSDLHLGKKVNGFSMAPDQAYILKETMGIIKEEKPDAVLIAGDLYDKPVPTLEAVGMLDAFITGLAEEGVEAFLISGNHDSPERVQFAAGLTEARGIHIDGTEPACRQLEDEYGKVNIFSLPFRRPADTRAAMPEAGICTYTDAIRAEVGRFGIDPGERNVLIAHQCVLGCTTSDSEDIMVGGSENVSADVFEGFDYVALGHLHRPQATGGFIRYSGSPLKYSFSETGDKKSLTVVEIREKGDMDIRTVPLSPLRDMKEVKGSFGEITSPAFYGKEGLQDAYIHITLTDENDVLDAVPRLQAVYPYLMKLDYENTRTKSTAQLEPLAYAPQKPLAEMFADFYKEQNGQGMSAEQVEEIGKIMGGES